MRNILVVASLLWGCKGKATEEEPVGGVLPAQQLDVVVGSVGQLAATLPDDGQVLTSFTVEAPGGVGATVSHAAGTGTLDLVVEGLAVGNHTLELVFAGCAGAPCTEPTATWTLPVDLRILASAGAADVTSLAYPLESRVVVVDGVRTVPDELSVVLAEAVDAAGADALAGEIGAVVVGGSPLLGLYQLRFPSPTEAEAALTTLQGDGRVVSARVMAIDEGQGLATPNEWTTVPTVTLPDGGATISFGAGQIPALRAPFEAIGMPGVWDSSTSSRAGSQVLVVDLGIYTPHTQLVGPNGPVRHERNPGMTAAAIWDQNEVHGTHVAGLACGKGNDGAGTHGSAWDCDLRVYDTLVQGGLAHIDKPRIATLISQLDRNRPIVVNLSVGTNAICPIASSTGFAANDPQTLEWRRVFTRFPEVVFVTAAGNCGVDLVNANGSYSQIPAGLAVELGNVLAVGNVELPIATSGARLPDPSSNLGEHVTIGAPGAALWSSAHACTNGSCAEGYLQRTGTSMATPVVSGLLSLMRAEHPEAAPQALKACVARSGADNAVEAMPAGLVDAAKVAECLAVCSAGDTEEIPGLGTAVCIPAGTFVMGCVPGRDDLDDDCGPGDQPQRIVTLSRPFWMMQTEASQTAYETFHTDTTFILASGCSSPDVCPVETTFADAVAFADGVSRAQGLPECGLFTGPSCEGWRLPTEAEWEWAARGDTSFIYPGSDEPSQVMELGANARNSDSCRFQPGLYGLCDLAGNMAEWTLDGGPVAPDGASLFPYELSSCGNGVLDPGEICDGAQVPACAGAGSITCNSDCSVDLSACPTGFCGANVPGSEALCEGTTLPVGLRDPQVPGTFVQGLPQRSVRSHETSSLSEPVNGRSCARRAAIEFAGDPTFPGFSGAGVRLVRTE